LDAGKDQKYEPYREENEGERHVAGKKEQMIYCWKIKEDELNIYMASSKKGAMHVGLQLRKNPSILDYCKKIFPQARVIEDESINQPLIEALKALLKGESVAKYLKLDILCTRFQRAVLEEIAHIPFSQTRTYGEVAMIMGIPGGARAIGQAMNKNPLPIIFP
jgi:O6-methylguanine-DNA--protein-cysteine methyltransferase